MTTNRRVSRLKILPKVSMIMVQLMMITLYSMLKSGVVRSMSSTELYTQCVAAPLSGTNTAGGSSQPHCGSSRRLAHDHVHAQRCGGREEQRRLQQHRPLVRDGVCVGAVGEQVVCDACVCVSGRACWLERDMYA